MSTLFEQRLKDVEADHLALLERKNYPVKENNGIYQRYQHPVITAAHTPMFWR